MQRYSRQMLLPEIGYSGQLLLQESKVLVIGNSNNLISIYIYIYNINII